MRPCRGCTGRPRAGIENVWENSFHPRGNPGANLKSISHRCHPLLVAFVWKLIKESILLPLGCLQGGFSDCDRVEDVLNSRVLNRLVKGLGFRLLGFGFEV